MSKFNEQVLVSLAQNPTWVGFKVKTPHGVGFVVSEDATKVCSERGDMLVVFSRRKNSLTGRYIIDVVNKHDRRVRIIR